jgi:YesN/AraC family two-component response regulator
MPKPKRVIKVSMSMIFTGSLIGMFSILLILMAISYSQFQESLLSSLTKQNEEFASQVSSTTKFADDILLSITNQLFYDPAVTLLRKSGKISNFEFIEGIRRINDIAASTILIDSIYIYNGEQDYIYSTAQYGAVNDTARRFRDKDAVRMLRERKSEQRLVIIPRETSMFSGSSNSAIYSFMFFETSPDGTPDANAILLNLKASAFTRLYFGSDFRNQAFIMNGEGALIASKDSLDESTRRGLIARILAENANGKASGYFTFPDAVVGEMLCFYSSLGEHNWIYVKTLAYEEAFPALLYSRNRTLIIISVIIIVLVAVSALIANRVYVPYRKIAQKISKAISGNGNENPDQIIRNLDQLIVEHDSRESLGPMIKNEILKDLLLGKKSIDMPDFNLESYHLQIAINFPITLYLLNGKDMVLDAEDIQSRIPYCEAVMMNSCTILFLQPMSQDQELRARNELIRKNPDTLLIYSEEIRDWSLIPDTYQKLRETWQLRFLHPEKKLIGLKDQPLRRHVMAPLSEKSAAVVGFLKKGLYSKAAETWNLFIYELEDKQYSTVNVALINIANAILKLAQDYKALDSTYEESCVACQTTIDGLDDIRELNRLFDDLFRKITDNVQQMQQISKKDTIHEISEYLAQNYTDMQISTKSIADVFNMSPAYLSRIYRQGRGHSLMDEINALRIQKAKEFLADPQGLIKHIPQKIGLENSQYFFLLFKKMTGKTPKAYQNDLVMLKKREAVKQRTRI